MPKYFVALEGLILKTSMVLSGDKAENRADPETVGKYTAEVLKKNVPEQVASVVFLSGGQTSDEATDNFRDCKMRTTSLAFRFSFSRAFRMMLLKFGQDVMKMFVKRKRLLF